MDALYILSIIQFVISSCVVIGVSILITAILYTKETRIQSFNVYLIGLQLVDLVSNLKLAFTHAWFFGHSLDNKDYLYKLIVNISVVIFAIVVNMYLSAIVAYQIYKLLKSSRRAVRINPPTIKRILVETGIVYTVGIILAIAYIGTTVTTLENQKADRDEVIWAWCLLGLFIIPFIFIVCITVRIWRRKLLPLSNDRTRAIAIYFGRIVSVFVLFYLPGTSIFAVGVATVVDDGIVKSGLIKISTGTIIFGLQGAFSFAVALTKDDIWDAVRTLLLRCNNKQQQQIEHDDNTNNNDATSRVDEESNIKTNGRDSNDTLATKNDIHDTTQEDSMMEASPHEEQHTIP